MAALAGETPASSRGPEPSLAFLVEATTFPPTLSHCDQVGHGDRRVRCIGEIPRSLSLGFGRAGLASWRSHKELGLLFFKRPAACDLIQGNVGDEHAVDVGDLILVGRNKFRQRDLQQSWEQKQLSRGYRSATDLDRGHRIGRPAKAARSCPLSQVFLPPSELGTNAPEVPADDSLKQHWLG